MSLPTFPLTTRYVAPGQVFLDVIPQPVATEVWYFTPKCHLKIKADTTVIINTNAGLPTTYRVLQIKLSKKAKKCDHPYIDARQVDTTTGTILQTVRQEIKVVC